MTVAQAAQDEVDAVRKEMHEKVKAAQETADRQVRMTCDLSQQQTAVLVQGACSQSSDRGENNGGGDMTWRPLLSDISRNERFNRLKIKKKVLFFLFVSIFLF